jgi:hypothetical protein
MANIRKQILPPAQRLFLSSRKTKVGKMANQPASDYSGKFPDSVPFFDFARLIETSLSTLTETAKQNSKLSTTLQALGKEWTEFVGAPPDAS